MAGTVELLREQVVPRKHTTQMSVMLTKVGALTIIIVVMLDLTQCSDPIFRFGNSKKYILYISRMMQNSNDRDAIWFCQIEEDMRS